MFSYLNTCKQKGKRKVKLFLFFALFVFFSPVCWGQLQVKIGNDTTFCAGNIEEGIQLASHLTIANGVAPYQYCWSISKPYEYFPERFFYASSMLNDTTLANPVFLTQYINDPQSWTTFILHVEDNIGNIAKDSINIRFSEFMASIPEPSVFFINKGDSIFFDISDVDYGGILPYASYEWIPKEGVSDPHSPKTWLKPDTKTHYICIATDSVGCNGSMGSGYLIILKSETSIQTGVRKNIIYQNNGTIFFDNPDNKNVKFSFYDLSGKLVHEGITTANQYNPYLTGLGVVLLCKININNRQETIKYFIQ